MNLHRQLFVDDEGIEAISGLTRTMHSVTKHPANPLLRPERPWEGERLILSNSAIFDPTDRLFKLWYGDCYAVSGDGLHWRRPSLGLVDFEGSTDNNIIRGAVSQVVYEPAAPAEERFKTLTCAQHGGDYPYDALFSSDGLVWTHRGRVSLPGVTDVFIAVCGRVPLILTDGPPTGAVRCEAGAVGLPPKYLGCVRLYCPVGRFDGASNLRPARRVLALTTSEDWLHWTNPRRILTPDALDDEMAHARIAAALADGTLIHDHADDHRCEFYSMYIIPYEGLFLGMLFVFDAAYEFLRAGKDATQAGPREVQLAASRDLQHWQRLGDRQPFIPRGATGEFDCGMIGYVCLPIIVGDELWFYYSGWTCTHAAARDEQYLDRLRAKAASGEWPPLASAGLATLRRDGFVSMDAGAAPGHLLTKPFTWPAGELHVNADARGGELSLEVLSETGEIVSGPGGGRCRPLVGDAPDHTVRWPQPNLTELAGHRVRLRFHLRRARLYSYWFE